MNLRVVRVPAASKTKIRIVRFDVVRKLVQESADASALHNTPVPLKFDHVDLKRDLSPCDHVLDRDCHF